MKLDWRCHTPRLLEEILVNPGTSTLKQPLIIFRSILVEVAQRAIELNDDKLNLLMLRLTLYSCGDPLCEDYDPDIIKQLEKQIKAKTLTPHSTKRLEFVNCAQRGGL